MESKAKINPDPSQPKLVREINLKNSDGTTNLDSVKLAMQLGGFSWINKLDNNHIGTPFFIGKAEGNNPTSGAAVDLKNKIIEYKHRIKEILGEDSVHVTLGLDVEREELNSDKKPTSWEMLNFNSIVEVQHFPAYQLGNAELQQYCCRSRTGDPDQNESRNDERRVRRRKHAVQTGQQG